MLRHHRPGPALAVALLALLVALGGTTAVAAPAVKRLIDGRAVKKGSLPGDRVKRDSLGGAQIDERKLGRVPRAARADSAAAADRAATAQRADASALADRAGHADSAGIADRARRADSAGAADHAGRADSAALADAVATYQPLALVRAAAIAGTDVEAALAAAPELPLGSRGPFTLYAKCVVVDSQPFAFVLVRTASEGTLAVSSSTHAVLGPSTPERERVLHTAALLPSFAAGTVASSTSVYTLVARSGEVARGTVVAYVRGEDDDGPLRGDERCLASGAIGA